MKKFNLILIGVLFVGTSAFAINLKKILKPGEKNTSAPTAATTTGGGGDAVLQQLKQCCNDVRYTDTNRVPPKQAVSKMQGCITQAGGSWGEDQLGPTQTQGLYKKWWQKGWGGDPEGCLTVTLNCADLEDADQICTSCTVVPSKGMASYCQPFAR